MRLPNFANFSKLNELLRQVGATPRTIDLSDDWQVKEIDLRLNEDGIDVDFTEIKIAADGGFIYEGRRVIIYIRDQQQRYRSKGYKYHLANCNTIESMAAKGRSSRYVVSNRTDGVFVINIMGTSERGIEEPMNVCKNCLSTLNWENYASGPYSLRKKIYNTFLLEAYFAKYRADKIDRTKYQSSATAPINDYTDDWNSISQRRRESVHYICENCRLDFSRSKQLLHVHHIDGMRANNTSSNLKALCVVCHAAQAGHGHLKPLPDYAECLQVHKQQGIY